MRNYYKDLLKTMLCKLDKDELVIFKSILEEELKKATQEIEIFKKELKYKNDRIDFIIKRIDELEKLVKENKELLKIIKIFPKRREI